MIWKRESSALHADCRVYSILAEKWTKPTSSQSATFYVMDVKDWVVALAKTSGEKYILVRQFRFGTESISLEFPAGLLEPGESPVEAAARELYEESGYSGENPEILGTVAPNPAIQRNRCHFVHFSNCRQTGPSNPDPHEDFEVEAFTLEKLIDMATEGKIQHSIVHSALFFLLR